jgi:hypothetical protein
MLDCRTTPMSEKCYIGRMIGICIPVLYHGPAAPLATKNDDGFYTQAKQMTSSQIPWTNPNDRVLPGPDALVVCEKLRLGAEIINTKADNSCHVDRRYFGVVQKLPMTSALVRPLSSGSSASKVIEQPGLRRYQLKGLRHD